MSKFRSGPSGPKPSGWLMNQLGNPSLGVTYLTIMATIQTTKLKALSLYPMHLRSLTLQAAETEHDGIHQFKAKPGSFTELSPLTRIGYTPNQS